MSTFVSRDRVSPRSTVASSDLPSNKSGASRPANSPRRKGATRSTSLESLCSFFFADGRQCRMPRRQGHPYLCTFHAHREARLLAAESAGEDIAGFLSGAYVSACDLNSALARLFVAVAQGHIQPKTASTLAYLGQTLVQALHLAQHEYINAFGTDSWRRTVRSSFTPPDPPSPPAPPTPSDTQPKPAAPRSGESLDSQRVAHASPSASLDPQPKPAAPAPAKAASPSTADVGARFSAFPERLARE